MRWVTFGILCGFLSGCCDSGCNMNNKSYVITQTQVDEMNLEASTPELDK